MTAAAFSADGSVLAVAAETVITLWDPDMNVLVGVLGDSFSVGINIFSSNILLFLHVLVIKTFARVLQMSCLQPIKALSFTGQSEHLVTASSGPDQQLSVWSLSRLTKSWSYMLQVEGLEHSFLWNHHWHYLHRSCLTCICLLSSCSL